MICFVVIPVIILILVIFFRCLLKNDVADYKPKKPVQAIGKSDEKFEPNLHEPKKVCEKEYKIVNFAVKGTIYRSSLEVQIAKNVKVGDMLLLKHESNNPKDAYAMKVLTTTAAHIGYVEKQYSFLFFRLLKSIDKCVVTKVTNDDIPFIYVDAYIEKSAYFRMKYESLDKIEVGKNVYVGSGVSFKVSTPRSRAMENCPDLALAEKLKYDHPEKAVDIFIRCAAEEEGLYSIHQACICYRRMKDYDSELNLILEILLVCKDEGLDDSIATYESRLQTVQKLIANRDKKNKKVVS